MTSVTGRSAVSVVELAVEEASSRERSSPYCFCYSLGLCDKGKDPQSPDRKLIPRGDLGVSQIEEKTMKTSLNNPLTIAICGVTVVLGTATYAYFKVPAWRAEQAQGEENAQQQIKQELHKLQGSGEAASKAEFCETAAMLSVTLSNTERSLEESAAPDEDGIRNLEALVDLQKTQKLIALNARDLESCKH